MSFHGTRSQLQATKSKLTEKSPPKCTETSALIAEVRQLRQEITEVKQQNLEIKLQMSSLSETLEHTLNEQSKQLQRAELQIATLKSTVGALQLQLAEKEQESMKNHVEITGIPEQNKENLSHIVMVASQKIGVSLAESDIEDVIRVGKNTPLTLNSEPQNKRPRPIVLKLIRKCKRDEILNCAKSRRNVTSEDVVSGNPTQVFFNERLTKENRRLFRGARLRAHEYGFRYCWVRSGYIYVRKEDGKPAIRITSHLVLDEKVGPAKSVQETAAQK
ncbi:hypothetical protein ABMA28_010689 [Loxostege sticticalis]|uniref:FP protein C-terminal domain-containing protein n=1 Tax=Loxostege sticticalis TaxID=481309 RepID=A0ABD0SB86_LOXSC